MKLITNKFKSVGLQEKHVVTTWNLLYTAKMFGYGSAKKGAVGEKCMDSTACCSGSYNCVFLAS